MDAQKRYDVFVSYRRRNAEGQEEGTHIARTIKLKLDLLMQNTDSCCFFDYSNMSNEDFPTRILKTIASAKVFVCVLTKNAMQRCGNEEDWVRREILQAKRYGLKIIFINPDGEFTGDYPFNFPKELDFVRTTNHLTVHTDSSFDRDMRAIYDEEIYPVIMQTSQSKPRPPRKPFNFALLKRVLIAVVALLCIAGAVLGTVSYVKEQKRIAEQERINEEKRIAEEERIAEERRKAEEERKAEEKRKAEQERIANEKRVAEEKRKAEEKRITEEKRLEALRNRVYKVGDYYDDGKKQGVVFEVTADGKHGKIVSLTESKEKLQWTSNEIEQKRLIGCDDRINGANNMAKVKQIEGWREKYPAFAWCANLGDGWYLPAFEELKEFTLDDDVHDAVNRTLATKGKQIANRGVGHWYLSSTEYDEFYACYVYMFDGGTYADSKYSNRYVRAVSAF